LVSAVYRGDEAKPSVQTCTCVHRTCNRYGVTGDRYGVRQSHPRCDPCYTLFWKLYISYVSIASQPFTSHFCLEILLFWVILSFIFAFFGLLTDLLWVDFPSHFPFFEVIFF